MQGNRPNFCMTQKGLPDSNNMNKKVLPDSNIFDYS